MWTLEEAAEAVGTVTQTFWRWENSVQWPRAYWLRRLCEVFDLPAEALGFGDLSHNSEYPVLETEQEETEAQSFQEQEEALVRLTPEQVTVVLSLLGDETIMAHFDPAKRATLRQILTAAGALSLGLHGYDPEPWEQLSLAQGRTAGLNPVALDHFEHLLGEGWKLSNINELEAASGIVASFLPKMLALDPSSIDTRTAFIASQALRLQSVLAAHALQLQKKVLLCEQAVDYARIAGDGNTLVSSLAELAVAYKYTDQPERSLLTYQEALGHVDQASSPLIQSRVYAASASAFARSGRKREARFYIDLANEAFPTDPAHDPLATLADYGHHLLIFYHGSVHLDLGEYEQAWNVLESVNGLGSAVPERNRLEIVNQQARVAVLMRDLDRYSASLETTLTGSLALKSRKRYNEAIKILHEEMPQSWWKEASIRELADRFQLKVGK